MDRNSALSVLATSLGQHLVHHEDASTTIWGQLRLRLPDVAGALPPNDSTVAFASGLVQEIENRKEWKSLWDLLAITAPRLLREHEFSRLFRVLAGESWELPESNELNPYRPLKPFTETDEKLYHPPFGLPEELTNFDRFHAIVGQPGSGKSSLARARILPGCTKLSLILSFDCLRYKTDDFSNFLFDRLTERLAVPPESTWSDVQIALLAGTKKQRVLVFFDQFEYALNRPTPGMRTKLLDDLVAVAKDDTLRIDVLVTMRADAVGLCQDHAAFYELLVRNRSRIEAVSRPDLKLAIAQPARAVGAFINDDLIDDLVADLHGRIHFLPALQITLHKLYEKAHSRSRMRGNEILLSRDLYTDDCKLDKAIEALIRPAVEGQGISHASSLPALFVHLLEPIEYSNPPRFARRSAPRERLGDAELVRRLVDVGILHVTLAPDGTELVQLAHDVLLDEWSALSEWKSAAFVHLKALLHIKRSHLRWQEMQKPREGLLSSVHLKEIRALLPEIAATIEHDLADYIRLSKRSQSLRRWRGILLWFIVVVGAAVLVQIAFKSEEARSLENHRNGIGALANKTRRSIRFNRPLLALEQAEMAIKKAGNDPVASGIAVQAVLDVLLDIAPFQDLDIPDSASMIDNILISRDDQTLIFSTYEQIIKHSLVTGVQQIIGDMDGESELAWAGDERFVLAQSRKSSEVRVFDLRENTDFLLAPKASQALTSPINSFEVLVTMPCPDSSPVSGDEVYCLTLFDISEGRPTALDKRKARVARYAASGAIYYSDDSRIIRWPRQSAENERIVFDGLPAITSPLLVSADERTLLVRVSDMKTSKSRLLLKSIYEAPQEFELYAGRPGDHATSVALSPDSKMIFVGYASGHIVGWPISSPNHPVALAPHTSQVSVLTFSADGERLFSGGYDSVVHATDMKSYTTEYYHGHEGKITAISSFHRDNTFATGSFGMGDGGNDVSLKLWRGTPYSSPKKLFESPSDRYGRHEDIDALAIGPDGSEVAVLVEGVIHRFSYADSTPRSPVELGGATHLVYGGDELYALDRSWRLWTLDETPVRLVKDLSIYVTSEGSTHPPSVVDLRAIALREGSVELVIAPGTWIRGLRLTDTDNKDLAMYYDFSTKDADVYLPPECAGDVLFWRTRDGNRSSYIFDLETRQNKPGRFSLLSSDCDWVLTVGLSHLSIAHQRERGLFIDLAVPFDHYIFKGVCDEMLTHCATSTYSSVYLWTRDPRELKEIVSRLTAARRAARK